MISKKNKNQKINIVFKILLLIFVILPILGVLGYALYVYKHIKILGYYSAHDYSCKLYKPQNIESLDTTKTHVKTTCTFVKIDNKKYCFVLPTGIFTQISPQELLLHPSFFKIDLNKSLYTIIPEFIPEKLQPTDSNINFVSLDITYIETFQLPLSKKLKIVADYIIKNVKFFTKTKNLTAFKTSTYVPFYNIVSYKYTPIAPLINSNKQKEEYTNNLKDAQERLSKMYNDDNLRTARFIQCHIYSGCQAITPISINLPQATLNSNILPADLCSINLQETFPNVPQSDKQIVTNLVTKICTNNPKDKNTLQDSQEYKDFMFYLDSYTNQSPFFIKSPCFLNPQQLQPNQPINTVYFDTLWNNYLLEILNKL